MSRRASMRSSVSQNSFSDDFLEVQRILDSPYIIGKSTKNSIVRVMKARSLSATRLLSCSLEELRRFFPNTSLLSAVNSWRLVELWIVEKLPSESGHFHSAAKTGNIIAVRDIISRRDLPKTCLSLLVNHKDTDNHNRTPLMDAAYNGHPTMVRFLVSNLSADVHAKDSPGQQLAIHLAAAMGRLHSVSFLIEKNSELQYALDQKGNMPLNVAAYNGMIGVVEFFVQKKAFLENKNIKDQTPLLQAAEQGHVDVVRLLAVSNADAMASESENGNTAIHLAAASGHARVVAFLVEFNPVLASVQNKHGKTALELARERDHQDVVTAIVHPPAQRFPSSPHNSLPFQHLQVEVGEMFNENQRLSTEDAPPILPPLTPQSSADF